MDHAPPVVVLLRNLLHNAKAPSIRYVSTANNVPFYDLIKKDLEFSGIN
jgi:hypothetical protein